MISDIFRNSGKKITYSFIGYAVSACLSTYFVIQAGSGVGLMILLLSIIPTIFYIVGYYYIIYMKLKDRTDLRLNEIINKVIMIIWLLSVYNMLIVLIIVNIK